MNTFFKIAKLFFPNPTVSAAEELPAGEPVVYVANHEKNFGPIVTQLFFPTSFHPWVIHRMLEKGECSSYIQETFFSERLGFPTWLSRILGTIVEPLLLRVMAAADPIPVYRDDPQRLIKTFRESLSILEQGGNLLIFPENPEAENYSSSVKDFYGGFIHVAKLYHRQTGRDLLFCPVSINPHQRTISIGKAVRFNSGNEFRVETERLRIHLMRHISDLYHPQRPSTAQTDPSSLVFSEEIFH